MIAKAVKGKGFRGALEYDLTKEKGQLLDTNMAGKNPRQLAAEFGEIRKLKPNLGKAVLHVSLSAAPGEKLTDAQWREIGQQYLKGMGLDSNQYVMTRHHDAAHEHIHIVANRIQFDGKVTSDSQDFKRQDTLMRQIEKQFNLVQIEAVYGQDGKKLAARKAPTKGEIEEGIRTEQPSTRQQLQQLCDIAAKACDSVTQYRDRLAAVGVEIVPSFQLEGAKLNGLSYQLDGVTMKGGDLGKAYSPVGLSKIGVTYDKNRDFESLSRDPKRREDEVAEGHLEVGRAIRDSTAASIGRPGQLKKENDRADRAVEQSGQATGAADREIGRASEQINAKLTANEIENDRIRSEALATLANSSRATDLNISDAGAAWESTVGPVGASARSLSTSFRVADSNGKIADRIARNTGSAIQGAERRVARNHVESCAPAVGKQLGNVNQILQQLVDYFPNIGRTIAAAAQAVARRYKKRNLDRIHKVEETEFQKVLQAEQKAAQAAEKIPAVQVLDTSAFDKTGLWRSDDVDLVQRAKALYSQAEPASYDRQMLDQEISKAMSEAVSHIRATEPKANHFGVEHTIKMEQNAAARSAGQAEPWRAEQTSCQWDVLAFRLDRERTEHLETKRPSGMFSGAAGKEYDAKTAGLTSQIDNIKRATATLKTELQARVAEQAQQATQNGPQHAEAQERHAGLTRLHKAVNDATRQIEANEPQSGKAYGKGTSR